MQVHNHSPLDCDEVGGMVTLSNRADNDTSGGGWTCDGCSTDAVADWHVERFEMYNADDAIGASTHDLIPLFREATGAVTLYQTECTNYYMLDPDGNLLGTCTRPEEPQEMD